MELQIIMLFRDARGRVMVRGDGNGDWYLPSGIRRDVNWEAIPQDHVMWECGRWEVGVPSPIEYSVLYWNKREGGLALVNIPKWEGEFRGKYVCMTDADVLRIKTSDEGLKLYQEFLRRKNEISSN